MPQSLLCYFQTPQEHPMRRPAPGSVEDTQYCLLESRLHQDWGATVLPQPHSPGAPEDPAMSPTELPSGLRPCQKLALLASPTTRGAESHQQLFLYPKYQGQAVLNPRDLTTRSIYLL